VARAGGSCRGEQPHDARARAPAGPDAIRLAPSARVGAAVRCAPRGAPLATSPPGPLAFR